MADIYHSFPIKTSIQKVFDAISTSKGLDAWWSKNTKGEPGLGAAYDLSFGPEYNWRAVVTKFNSNREFELQFTKADDDWINTKVGFALNEKEGCINVQFYHTGWPQINDHYKISSYCWAMYLRILKRYLEFNEQIKYEQRLDV